MLSRKVPGAAGIDRARVAERLRAALAGLEEMRFLRAKQSDMVLWALRMDQDRPLSPPHGITGDADATGEDQRLEATLSSLKQKLACRDYKVKAFSVNIAFLNV
uniref:Uncharacterized protein n=1 Tax=Electrophorus electricus TaxID=8005 RepID=A0AAY5EFC9_ELEEL